MSEHRVEVTVAGPTVTRAVSVKDVVEYLRSRGAEDRSKWVHCEVSPLTAWIYRGRYLSADPWAGGQALQKAIERIAVIENREPWQVLQDISTDAQCLAAHQAAREQWHTSNPVHMLFDGNGHRLYTCSGCLGPATRIDEFDRYACLACDHWLEPPCLPEPDGRALFPPGPPRPSMLRGETEERGCSAGGHPISRATAQCHCGAISYAI